jgi:hypothetical protein
MYEAALVQGQMPTTYLILVVCEAVVFLAAALAHTGIRLPILMEPRIIPATIVEGACGILFAVSAFSVIANAPWALPVAFAAQFIALAGVALGVISLALGVGPRTKPNDLVHGVMLLLILAGMVLLVSSTSGAR